MAASAKAHGLAEGEDPGVVRRLIAVVSVVAAVIPASATAGLASVPGPGEPTRIMLVGDSVTQGSSGDWTWRYRLWNHLQANRAAVDFVGPVRHMRTYPPPSRADRTYSYADPDFDWDHAAAWGTAFGYQPWPIADLVTEHRPHVIVELYGINNFIWFGQTPDTVLALAQRFVAEVRSADPDVDIVMGLLPQTWSAGAEEFNSRLPGIAKSLDTPNSRVVIARTGRGFVERRDTFDPSHLTATGELKIAAGVADALAGLGIGVPYPRPLPKVRNGPVEPARLRARAGRSVVRLSWNYPPGGTEAYIWIRNLTTGGKWRKWAGPVVGDRWPVAGLWRHHDHAFRVQVAKGSAVARDRFSNVVVVHGRR